MGNWLSFEEWAQVGGCQFDAYGRGFGSTALSVRGRDELLGRGFQVIEDGECWLALKGVQ